jgi:hypothetical protein
MLTQNLNLSAEKALESASSAPWGEGDVKFDATTRDIEEELKLAALTVDVAGSHLWVPLKSESLSSSH